MSRIPLMIHNEVSSLLIPSDQPSSQRWDSLHSHSSRSAIVNLSIRCIQFYVWYMSPRVRQDGPRAHTRTSTRALSSHRRATRILLTSATFLYLFPTLFLCRLCWAVTTLHYLVTSAAMQRARYDARCDNCNAKCDKGHELPHGARFDRMWCKVRVEEEASRSGTRRLAVNILYLVEK